MLLLFALPIEVVISSIYVSLIHAAKGESEKALSVLSIQCRGQLIPAVGHSPNQARSHVPAYAQVQRRQFRAILDQCQLVVQDPALDGSEHALAARCDTGYT